MSNCENCANAYDEGYTAGHNSENARLRQDAQSGAATFEDLYVRDREIARLRAQAEALAGALEAVSEDASKNHDPRCTDELISGFVMENARVALRAYREATQ